MQLILYRCLLMTLLLTHLPATVSGQDTLSSGMPGYNDILDDWKDQDTVVSKGYRTAITRIIAGLPSADRTVPQARLNSLSGGADNSAEMVQLYVSVCSARRAQRLVDYVAKFPKIVFSEHAVRGGGYFTQGLPEAGGYQGKGIALLGMNGYYGSVTQLLPTGEARDPDVSFDGKRVVFAWRGGTSGSSVYHLYEMNLATRVTRQITTGNNDQFTVDFNPAYLPNGNIVFVSTRYAQEVDCIDGQVTNLFLCDKDGKCMRQIGFDQAPILYPTVLSSGEVAYARWDYNDKAHSYAHALFLMHPDGTAQRELCNNNSWWPTMILQQRPIPGTMKLMAMIGGYHTRQWGKIGIINTNLGMQNGKGVTLVAPVREPRNDVLDSWGSPTGGPYQWRAADAAVFPKVGAAPLDRWGQNPPMFAYPYPFDENAFLVSFKPASKDAAWGDRMGLFFMTVDGHRELLYYDPAGSCMGAVPAVERPVPPDLASAVNYRDSTGVFQIMNIYKTQSPLLDGVAPGTIKRLRVVELYFRPGPVVDGSAAYSHLGPGDINYGGATYHTAIATTNASWDAKWILGETPVYSDGSAAFIVPARTPVFFQALDAAGQVVQTMRSWATLQPGETFSCMGCHESRMEATPPITYTPIALQQGNKPLEPFYGPRRGFSFDTEIQPIFDAKCVSCHNGAHSTGLDLRKGYAYDKLTAHGISNSYSKYVNWFHAEDSPILQPPYRAGSSKSLLITRLTSGQMPPGGRVTKEELDKITCWIDIGVPKWGTYEEGHPGSEANLVRRRAWQTIEKQNIKAYLAANPGSAVVPLNAVRTDAAIARMVITSSRQVVFELPAQRAGKVMVRLYDLRGALARTLVDGELKAGYHRVSIDVPGRAPMAPGRYILKVQSAGIRQQAGVSVYR